MIETIYIEESIVDHPRTRRIVSRFANARNVFCERYTEVFNPKAQNFRIQKQCPALILAEKRQGLVLPSPENYGLGAQQNYYFSHMLNCLYDCRYCFLQGMYHSANYVVFVNFEDFADSIRKLAENRNEGPIHFFSGYDCDSLAFNPVTGFTDFFTVVFDKLPNALLELRTKSTQIRALTDRPALPNCVVAFSFTPRELSAALEHKVPAYTRRLEAMAKLEQKGWKIGLRFDPLIYQSDYKSHYKALFNDVFSIVDPDRLHSVSYGNFRLPQKFFNKMTRLYPDEKLFAGPLRAAGKIVSYEASLETEMMEFCSSELRRHVSESILFPCSI